MTHVGVVLIAGRGRSPGVTSLKPLVPPHIAAFKPSSPGNAAGTLRRDLDLTVKLAGNENPFGPSPKVQRALAAALANVHRYPDDDGHALRARLSTHHGVGSDEISLGYGSSALIDLIARTFASPAEHAIVGAPSFPAFGISLAAANVTTTAVPLRDGLFWDLQSVHRAVRPETKLVFLDNPCNPTSTHIPQRDLQDFLRELPVDVIVVVDEAYAEYADDATYQSALCMRHLRERLIVLRTFSKARALASLRLGYAVAPPELTAHLEAMRIPFSVSGLGQAAALESLDDVEHLQQSCAWNTCERARLSDALRRAGLAVAPSQTNFLFVALPCAAALVHHGLLERGVLVRALGPALPRHLRISVGLRDENDTLLHALSELLSELGSVRYPG